MTMLNQSVRRGTALLAAVSACMSAHAQTPQDRTIDEIVVTAQRRAEVLEDVPMSVTVVTPESLAASGVTSIHDISQVASGVQVNWAGAFTQPAIRGVTSLTNGYGENNVAIYVDGFYDSSTVAINQDLANIASIQVLKGPQGALYGRNATGGAILINTLEPSDITTGSAEVTYARFNDRRFKGYFSSPITDKLAFSVAAYWRKSDGWLDFADPATHAPAGVNPAAMPDADDPAPLEQRSVRTKLRANITDNLTATLAYNYGYSNSVNGNLYSTYEYRPATLPPAPKFGEVAYNYDTKQLAKTDEVRLKVEWLTDIGTLTSYTGYTRIVNPLQFDFDGTYADLSSTTSNFKQYTKQQTLDFAINAIDRMDLIIGASFINDDIHADPDNLSTNWVSCGPTCPEGRIAGTQQKQALEAEAWAIYIDGTYRATDKLSLSAGARYTDEYKRGEYSSQCVIAGIPGCTVAGAFVFAPTNKYMSFNKLTPRASVRYELAPQTNVYASYSKGFRSGTISLSGAATPDLWLPVDPETIDAYEVGFKTAQGMYRFDIAAFLYDYKDLHVSITRPNPLGPSFGQQTVFQNAKKAEIYGLDGSFDIALLDDFNIRLGATWLHARYKDFDNASGTALNPATGLNVTTRQNWNGKEMARAPEFSANLGADYTVHLPYGSVLMAANVRYTDSYVINNPSLFGGENLTTGEVYPGDKQRYRQDSMTLVNASLTWNAPDEHLYIGVFGTNLTNKKYLVTYTGTAGFGDYGTQAEPRTYGARVGYKF
jgi:iron complex outermembrane receptor protein